MNIISKIFTGKSLAVVLLDGNSVRTERANDTHINWQLIVKAYKTQDWDKVAHLINTRTAIKKQSHNRFTVENDKVYFNGEEVCGFLFDQIISYLHQGLEFDNLLRFADLLYQNPSSRARTELYRFLANRNYTIDNDGYVIGWKGVRNDYWSHTGNLSTKVIRGNVDAAGRILNKVGEHIEVERGYVDDNCNNTCSHGLHIGSRSYAEMFKNGGRLMVVRFNPKDAVSVPTDESGQKLRVCAYEVIAEEEGDHKVDSLQAGDAYTKPLPKRDKNGRFC